MSISRKILEQADSSKVTLAVFGPNLQDQSKGTFVVHTTNCKDCGKLRGEQRLNADYDSKQSVIEDLYGDIIREDPENNTWQSMLSDVYFAPCVRLPLKHLEEMASVYGNAVEDDRPDEPPFKGDLEKVMARIQHAVNDRFITREQENEFLDKAERSTRLTAEFFNHCPGYKDENSRIMHSKSIADFVLKTIKASGMEKSPRRPNFKP